MAPDPRDLVSKALDKLAVCASDTGPPKSSLKLGVIQEAVKEKGMMDTDSLNFAIRKMARKKSSDGKHYIIADFAMSATSVQGSHPSMETFIDEVLVGLRDALEHCNIEVLCVPLIWGGHWTLFAFNLKSQILTILDSLLQDSHSPGLGSKSSHLGIRRKVCEALQRALAKFDMNYDFSAWDFLVYPHPLVPQQEIGSNDCGFFVFNFMRHWNGYKLVDFPTLDDVPTKTTLTGKFFRKEFLAYILSSDDDEVHGLPDSLDRLMEKLPSDPEPDHNAFEDTPQLKQELLGPVGEEGVKMANIQQQPWMDHILLQALTNRNAFGILQLVNPSGLPDAIADHVLVPLPYQEATGIAVQLQGVTSDGDGVLHIAARFEDVELVRAISSRWRHVVDVAAKNKRGETALHCAAATGNANMINLLIRLSGVNGTKRLLREQKNNGETCLHEAVRFGNTDAVQRLVEQDFPVYVPDGSLTLVQIKDNEGVSPLYLATTLRHLEIVQCLTEERGVYPAASYDGPGSKTALHAAVLLSKELSEHLANWNNKELIDKPDESGSTPLHLLASTKDKFIMKLLLDLDTSAGYRADNEGSLPIHVAATNGSLEIVKLLSEHRPNCSWSCNSQGQTILHIAVQNRKSNVVKYVCSGKKFERIINMRDIDGNTAIHLAVLEADQFIFCRLMRKKEVCLSIINKKERTPLHN